MRYLLILLLCSCSGVNSDQLNYNNLYIYQTPNKDLVVRALNVVIDELDRISIFTKEDMYNIINSKNLVSHSHICPAERHSLSIIFQEGIFAEKDFGYCIFTEAFKDQCLSGYYDGYHSIYIIYEDRIYKTAFAHEILHYFIKYIGNPNFKNEHNPPELWAELVGFRVQGEIGILNKALKAKDL